jgi:predicted hotdog family 3-hydroxylacyl-ACP dehydratase
MLDHAWILAHVPHQGRMCLLDRVDTWNESSLQCRAHSHRNLDNPLRAHGRLAAACGIEYAAQAMAIHGALLAAEGSPPATGYLTSVRSVELQVSRLDTLQADLQIAVERLSGDENNVLYQFSLAAAGQLLLTGRASVVLDAGARRSIFPGSSQP